MASPPIARSQSALAPTFAEVAERHLDGVHRYLVHLTRDRQLAEDLAGETFERALRAWGRYDPRRGTPGVWLCRIARNVALDHYRAEGRRLRRDTRYAAEQDQAAHIPDGLDGLSGEMRAALAKLTQAEREVIALRVVLDLDAADAAEVMGVSPSACSSQLHRALTKLRREVSDRAG